MRDFNIIERRHEDIRERRKASIGQFKLSKIRTIPFAKVVKLVILWTEITS